MRYVEARIEEYNREEAYRIYVSNSLQLAPQNKYMQKSYRDIIDSIYNPPKQVSGDEIVADIISRAGLKFEDS